MGNCMDLAKKGLGGDFGLPGISESTRAGATLENTNPEGLERGKEAMNRSEEPEINNSGQKKALMIGLNYRGTKAELKGCINDVINLKTMLLNVYGFHDSDITTMTDDNVGSFQPTRENITRAIRELVQDARPGDVFFFSYSGHGGQMDDCEGFEEDGMNETLIPLDFQESGMIPDGELNDLLVKPLPSGCKLTVFFDACHSGTGLDLPYRLSPKGWVEAVNPLFSKADVCMISGCMDEQTSADAFIQGASSGALTHALLTSLRPGAGGQTYVALLQQSHAILDKGKYTQRPVFTSNQAFDLSRPFSFDMSLPNKNEKDGRVERRKFKPGSGPNPNAMAFMESIGVGNLGTTCAAAMSLVQKYMGSGGGGGGVGGLGALGSLMGGGGGDGGGIGMSMFKKFLAQQS